MENTTPDFQTVLTALFLCVGAVLIIGAFILIVVCSIAWKKEKKHGEQAKIIQFSNDVEDKLDMRWQ